MVPTTPKTRRSDIGSSRYRGKNQRTTYSNRSDPLTSKNDSESKLKLLTLKMFRDLCGLTRPAIGLEILIGHNLALKLSAPTSFPKIQKMHKIPQNEAQNASFKYIIANDYVGVWFFRNYARVNLKDMNYHSVCLHVLAESIRSLGLILASWLFSLGVQDAEVLCFGLVSMAFFMLVMPLFKSSGGILLQMAPPSFPPSTLNKYISELSQAWFWEFVPSHIVGSLSIQVKEGIDDRPILQYVHGLYHELGIQDLTVQTDDV
ncbi:hypothetical protein UlMin_005142 [Ulmus minor]